MTLHGLHGKIGCCGCCDPREIARHTIYEDNPDRAWHLEKFQGDDVGTGGSYWRVINDYMSYVPMQKGCVDENGKLVGLPDSIAATAYKYTWIFKLEIGCLSADGENIIWPERKKTDVFLCQR